MCNEIASRRQGGFLGRSGTIWGSKTLEAPRSFLRGFSVILVVLGVEWCALEDLNPDLLIRSRGRAFLAIAAASEMPI